MDMNQRIIASSPDLSETASLHSSAQPQQQQNQENKTRSDSQLSDGRHERPNEKGMQKVIQMNKQKSKIYSKTWKEKKRFCNSKEE